VAGEQVKTFCIVKRILICIVLVAMSQLPCKAANSELKPYVEFLEAQHTSAKDYVLSLFQSYDIVILCERDHREMTQYDLLLDILGDKRFTQDVKNVYCEIGNVWYNDALNHFLHNPKLSQQTVADSAMYFQRYRKFPLWDKANFSYFLTGTYRLNQQLPPDSKVSIRGLGGNAPATTDEDIQQLLHNDRYWDEMLAANFMRYYQQGSTQKALVVLNYRHAFLFGDANAGALIAKQLPGKVANVYISSLALQISDSKQKGDEDGISYHAIQGGRWDASFIQTKKTDLGFNLNGTPFGKASCDMIPAQLNPGLTYGDVFTGMVYYRDFRDFQVVEGIENFVDGDFAKELEQRRLLYNRVAKQNLQPEDLLKSNTVRRRSYREEMPEAVKEIEAWLK
jgi:hypothetical protein